MAYILTETLPYEEDAAQGMARSARLILNGLPVAIPTETVYGLAADATSPQAVARIYEAKGRPSFNPLIIHVADMEMAQSIGQFSPFARQLAEVLWPGPVTFVVPQAVDSPIASLATAGLDTIAIRMPEHRAMQALIRAAGKPLAAPSANASGGISPTQASHVVKSLGGRIALVVDDGPTMMGLESTIIGINADDSVTLLRPGPITMEALEQISGKPVSTVTGDTISAPGQLTSHYAPSKAVRLNALSAQPDEWLIGCGDVTGDATLSSEGDLVEAAANLFTALHQADASAASSIAVAPVPIEGLGLAINDRLQRAAADRSIFS